MPPVSLFRPALVILLSLYSTAALSNETAFYTYDALGRLVGVSNNGTVNNGVSVTYSYDASGNRSNVTVTGVTLPIFSVSDATIADGQAAGTVTDKD